MLQARARVEEKQWTITPGQQTGPVVKPSPYRKGKAKLVLTGLICFLLCLAVTAQYSRIVALGIKLSTTEAKIIELREEHRELEATAARLASLSRVEEVAREELGMREPEKGQLKVLTAFRE